MVQVNFGNTFTLRQTVTVNRALGFEPDWFFNQAQVEDSVVVHIISAVGALSDSRPAVYICPALRTTNPTGLLLLQSHKMRAFPGQRVVFNREMLMLDSLDPQGGNNRRDLVPAVWVLKPFTSVDIQFYTD